MPSYIYTVFLLKDDLARAADARDPEKVATVHELADGLQLRGTLFVGGQRQATPAWVELMNPYLQQPIDVAYTASISAVLIVEHENRLFALTFGYGKSLLRPNSWVRGFGLKVTLNRVNARRLRSVDSKIYDDLVVATRRQTSQSSQLENFEIDVMRALVQGVTGDAENNPAFSRMTGADGLRVTSELPIGQLGELLEEIFEAYNDDAYRELFGWIDNIREVDPGQREQLDDLLIESLDEIDATQAYLAPADVVNWENVYGFNFTNGPKRVTYFELNISEYLRIQRDKGAEIDADLLKRHKVRVRSEENGILRDQWPVYDCIVWEVEHQGGRFVLFDGRWFAVDSLYALRVSEFVESILSAVIAFPDSPAEDDEADYNDAVANAEPNLYALLDLQRFRPTGAATDIEFCDLFSSQRQLIHVKKRTSSATLSHLFSQGSVAAELFLQDQGLRDLVRDRLVELDKVNHAALVPNARPIAADYEIVYAIMAREGANGWPPLPFFSAVNLMHHASRIQTLGYRVSLQYVRQV